ncbi:MAG: hypothetical protein Q9169_006881 [Polycauliona sp. 2 TL-2023]
MTTVFQQVFSRETRYPIFSCLCEHLDNQSIFALSKTCRQYSGLYNYLLPSLWNVDKRLRRFVNDPVGLRSKMKEFNVLISGSFPIQFFERVTWPASDLDLYIKEGEGFDGFCSHLAEFEGYTLKTTKNSYDLPYPLHYITSIRKYTRPIPGSQSDQVTELHVIATNETPMHAILNNFYTTVNLNFITWNKAYSVFPLTTFIHKRGHLLRHEIDADNRRLVNKYKQRGWDIQGIIRPEDQRVNHPFQQHRRIGDKYTWMIPVDIDKIEGSSTPDTVLLTNCAFQISGAHTFGMSHDYYFIDIQQDP